MAPSGAADGISVSWLQVRPLGRNAGATGRRLPLPRFAWTFKSPAQIDPRTRRHIIAGYVTSRNAKLFLVGHHDGQAQSLTLIEPASRSFTFMHGACLLTSPEDGQIHASRVICHYLGRDAARSDWEVRMGTFTLAQIERHFDGGEAVGRALGKNASAVVVTQSGVT